MGQAWKVSVVAVLVACAAPSIPQNARRSDGPDGPARTIMFAGQGSFDLQLEMIDEAKPGSPPMALVGSADIVSVAVSEGPIATETPHSIWLEPELVIQISPTAAAVIEEIYPKPGPGYQPLVHHVGFSLVVCGKTIPIGGYLDDDRIYAPFYFSDPPKTFEEAESIVARWIGCKYAA